MATYWIIAILLIVAASRCPATLTHPHIVSGTLSLLPNSPAQTVFSYVFLQPFQNIPQAALGIVSMSTPQQVSQNDNSFYVIPRATSTMIQVTSRLQTSNWFISRITFLASTSSELLLSTLSAPVSNTGIQTNNFNVIFKLSSTHTLNLSDPPIVRTHLNGLSTVLPLKLLNLEATVLYQTQINMSVTLSAQAHIQLWISVVAFSSNSSTFTAYGGSVIVDRSGTLPYDLLQTFVAVQNPLYGINSLQLSLQSQTTIDIQLNSFFVLFGTMVGQQSRFEINYMFIGQAGGQVCQQCASQGQGSMYYNWQCLPSCPSGAQLVTLGNSGQLCRDFSYLSQNISYSSSDSYQNANSQAGPQSTGYQQAGSQQPNNNTNINNGSNNQNVQYINGVMYINGIRSNNGGSSTNGATTNQNTIQTSAGNIFNQNNQGNSLTQNGQNGTNSSSATNINGNANTNINATINTGNLGSTANAQSNNFNNFPSSSGQTATGGTSSFNSQGSTQLNSQGSNNPENTQTTQTIQTGNQGSISQGQITQGGSTQGSSRSQGQNVQSNTGSLFNSNGQTNSNSFNGANSVSTSGSSNTQGGTGNNASGGSVNNQGLSISGVPTISTSTGSNANSPNNNGKGVVSLPSSSSNQMSSMCPGANMFFNGARCLCMVGYSLVNNACVPTAYVPPHFYTVPNSSNGGNNGNNNNGSNGDTNTQCQGLNQYFNGTACICLPNYYLLSGICTFQTTISCPQGAINNGLGVCICTQTNTRLINNSCLTITNCPINQIWNGASCYCDLTRFTLTNNQCQPRCSTGSLWQQGMCVPVCRLNQAYNTVEQKCMCIPGFGISFGGACEECRSGYYIVNGYCITCPVNSIFTNGGCQCSQGFVTSINGQCISKCQALQIYNQNTTQCECRSGLVKINGVCSLCPANSYLSNGLCITCPSNSYLSSTGCLCNPGYILNSLGQHCVSCNSLPNTFLINNRCARCPGQLIYNQINMKCECAQGQRMVGSKCIQNCNEDELLDSNGRCYSCGINMVPSNGTCVCRSGYVRNSSCGCILLCNSNQFIYNGGCAICPPSMIYSPQIRGCICPFNSYWSQLTNSCQNFPVPPPNNTTCPQGQYYDTTILVCISCPSNCISCLASNQCTLCQNNYQLVNGRCAMVVPYCGDGLISNQEQCDTGSMSQPGCINCIISQGYTCIGQPSICTPTVVPPSGDSLTLVGQPNSNTNNVFITLRSTPTFTFPNENAQRQFIKASFMGGFNPTFYCLQRATILDLFDCLLIYPSGIPNTMFTITFSYNYQGHFASTNVTIDPLNSVLNGRNN